MVDGRKVFEKPIKDKIWLIKEMNVEDALMVSTGIAKITGTSLFSLVASILSSKNEKDENIQILNDIEQFNSQQLKDFGLDDETLNQFESIKKYSGLFKKVANIFQSQNKEIVQEFLQKIYHKDLITLSKGLLREASYIQEGNRIPITLNFDEYFTATKLPELMQLFIFAFEVNFKDFFPEFLEKDTKDSNTEETETT